MTLNHSYLKELELLITETLLPAYVREQKAKGVKDPMQGINQKLLDQIKEAKRLPALLRPKEK